MGWSRLFFTSSAGIMGSVHTPALDVLQAKKEAAIPESLRILGHEDPTLGPHLRGPRNVESKNLMRNADVTPADASFGSPHDWMPYNEMADQKLDLWRSDPRRSRYGGFQPGHEAPGVPRSDEQRTLTPEVLRSETAGTIPHSWTPPTPVPAAQVPKPSAFSALRQRAMNWFRR